MFFSQYIYIFNKYNRINNYFLFTNQTLVTSQLLLDGAGFGISIFISTGTLKALPKATQLPGFKFFNLYNFLLK